MGIDPAQDLRGVTREKVGRFPGGRHHLAQVDLHVFVHQDVAESPRPLEGGAEFAGDHPGFRQGFEGVFVAVGIAIEGGGEDVTDRYLASSVATWRRSSVILRMLSG